MNKINLLGPIFVVFVRFIILRIAYEVNECSVTFRTFGKYSSKISPNKLVQYYYFFLNIFLGFSFVQNLKIDFFQKF